MKVYTARVLDKDRKLLFKQPLFREDWNGFLGHLNRELPEWRYIEVENDHGQNEHWKK